MNSWLRVIGASWIISVIFSLWLRSMCLRWFLCRQNVKMMWSYLISQIEPTWIRKNTFISWLDETCKAFKLFFLFIALPHMNWNRAWSWATNLLFILLNLIKLFSCWFLWYLLFKRNLILYNNFTKHSSFKFLRSCISLRLYSLVRPKWSILLSRIIHCLDIWKHFNKAIYRRI
jgi:hypothetical protein